MNRREFGLSLLTAAAGSVVRIDRSRAALTASQKSPRFNLSAMLWTILPDQPFGRRIAAVAEAGYRFVELFDEFARWSAGELEENKRLLLNLNVAVDAICLDRPGVANPAAGRYFLEQLKDRVTTAKALNCRDIIVVSGSRLASYSHEQQRQASIDILRRGGQWAGARGCRLLLESLDPEEAPYGFLNSVVDAFDIVRAVASPHVKAVYDFYHEQIAGGNLIRKMAGHVDLIGVVHVADVPGRHEPGSGEINYCTVLRRLTDFGFQGQVAMEFLPTDTPVKSLTAARDFVERCG